MIRPSERRRLDALLPWARAEAKKQGGEMRAISPVAQSQMGSLKSEANLAGIAVYPGDLGGWHCDLIFQGLPPGVPDVWGTPVAEPLATRAEAEAHAKTLLVSALVAIATPKEEAPPVFKLYDGYYSLDPQILAWIEETRPPEYRGTEGYEQSLKRLKAFLAEVCPRDPLTELHAFESWPHDRKATLLSILHTAAVNGLSFYPPRKPGMPVQSEARH